MDQPKNDMRPQKCMGGLKSHRMHQIIMAILVIIAIVALIPIIGAAFFAHPSADDFNYSIQTHKAAVNGGIIEVLGAAWSTLTSFLASTVTLYSSVFFQSLQPGIFGDEYYWITCPIMLAFSLIGVISITRSLARYLLGCNVPLLYYSVSLIIWLITILALPSPSEGLYWFNGAMNYIPFWACCSMTIGLLIKYYCGCGNNAFTVICASALSALVAGSHQIDSSLLIILSAYMTFRCIHDKRMFLTLIPLFFAFAGFLFVALHPGTALRAESLGTDHSIIRVAGLALWYSIKDIANWFDFKLLLMGIALLPLYVAINRSSCQNSALGRIATPRILLEFALMSLLLVFALNCVPSFALGSSGPGRLQNIIYATFVVLFACAWFVVVSILLRMVDRGGAGLVRISNKCNVAVIAVALFLAIVSPGTFTSAVLGILDGSLAEYSSEIDSRNEYVLAHAHEDITVPSLTVRPSLIFFDDITCDPKDWRNKSFSRYYDVASVKTE